MLTSARIPSATASASAAVDLGCCLNHTVVAFGIVYLFKIDLSLDVHATPRSCAADKPSRAGDDPTHNPDLLMQALELPPDRRVPPRAVDVS